MKLLLFLLCLATADEAAQAQAMGPTVLEKGLYSYQAPAGWKVADSPVDSVTVSTGPMEKGFTPEILIFVQTSKKLLPDYVDSYLNSLQADPAAGFKILEQNVFSTSSGLPGLRVTTTAMVHSRELRQVFYFFEVGADKILVGIASCLKGDGPRADARFNASIQTLSLE